MWAGNSKETEEHLYGSKRWKSLSCVCASVCTWCESKIRLVLWDLTEPLPWIELDISKAWHGKGLLLSSHCFIYHPKVCVFVCVFTFLGFAQACLCLSMCPDVNVRKGGERGRERGEEEKVCVNMNVSTHTCLWAFGNLDSVQVLSSLLFFLYIIFITRGQWWSQEQNFNEVCAFVLSLCACMCLCIYNTRTVMQRGAAYWLSEVEERASVLAGRAT